MNTIALLIMLAALSQIGVNGETNSTNNTFVATKEWQEIRKGQGIPAGLHVRINLHTGKKEAKLLDESEQKESKESALSTLPENASETPISKAATTKRSKDANSLIYSPEKLEKVQKDYETYKQFKNFKSDAAIITQLIDEYRNLSKAEPEVTLKPQSKTKAQMNALESFNDLMHQYENALWFIDEGGLDYVLLPLIVNETNIALRVQAMRVLGALTQNNVVAKIKVFERNFGSHLAQILLSSTNTEELSSALYAFGAILRRFPLAQQRILSTSGIQALVAVLSKECELKIKAKAAILIGDVVEDKRIILSTSPHDLSDATEYAELNFDEWLQANAFCDTLDALISTKLYEFLEQPDIAEYFVQALDNTRSICFSLWSQSPQLRHTLLTLMNRYKHSQEGYRLEVAEQLAKVISLLYPESNLHDEL